MWPATKVTRLLNIRYPIVQGPFGGGQSSIELTAAVSNLGGLGSFGANHLPPAEIADTIRNIRERTSESFAVNLWVDNLDPLMAAFGARDFEHHVDQLKPYFSSLNLPLPDRPAKYGQVFAEQMHAVLDAAPPAFSFVFGVPPATVLDACKEKGIVTIGNATTVAEARAIANAGVDIVVATGFEAGGHRVSFIESPEECLIGTFSLVPQVSDAVAIPVIAAGGISDGRGVAAALMLGADAVQVGTAFLACEESGTSRLHRSKLFSEEASRTALTRAFSGRLARSIRNSFLDDMAGRADDVAPYPAQQWIMNCMRSAAIIRGRSDMISLYAGQSAPLLKHRHAADLFRALVDEASAALQSAASPSYF